MPTARAPKLTSPSPPALPPAANALEVRDHLRRALEVDLVGPYVEEELLDRPPSRLYLTGFLAPREASGQDADPTEAALDELADSGDEGGELDLDVRADDTRPAGEGARIRQLLPSSIGLSVLLPPGPATDTITVRVSYALYTPVHPEGAKKTTRPQWQRHPQPPAELVVALDPAALEPGLGLPALPAVRIRGRLRTVTRDGQKLRALSIFVVNEQTEGERGRRDERYLFQVRLEVERPGGFSVRPPVIRTDEIDDKIAALQYHRVREVAVGHGVAVEQPPPDGPVTRVRTTWLPTTEVSRVTTNDKVSGVERLMSELAKLGSGDAVRAALATLPVAYEEWIAAQQAASVPPKHAETLATLVDRARGARARIQAGIDLLAADDEARAAFRLMNDAMGRQARQRAARLGLTGEPTWRLFQLAFILLTLPSLFDEKHPEREAVELIFFPTGGGKTEAYLGVIAFTLCLRRMRGRSRPDRGLGVAVILRYTLRLLTLDQLERAATLICALERLRVEQPALLGSERFSVGLWVGRGATANRLRDAHEEIKQYQAGEAASPCPLARCPWCDTPLKPHSLTVEMDGKDAKAVRIGCPNDTCPFAAANDPLGLPVAYVDEQLYRELPCFVVGTVDKFAMIPWRGEAGRLFGKVAAFSAAGFFGHDDKIPKGTTRTPDGLPPPELIVQDELHLITGPLGTMVGLYETAVEELASRGARPKVIASTATVRRAEKQVRALLGRGRVELFPPAGPVPGETFFAVNAPSPGRLYVGVAAPGRAFRQCLARVYATLFCAAAARWVSQGPDDPADPYMTLVGYYNQLRELGAMRRVVEEEVPQRTRNVATKLPAGAPALLAAREPSQLVELTSREPAPAIKQAKDRLGRDATSKDRVDVVLASNMISVGVDITRLGLMVVAGQPTTTAEYIQATSRVGRDERKPGLIVTCYNPRRVRDRSYFERFCAYHESFYGSVEASSLTPFAGPALDRALAGVMMGMVRHLHPDLVAALGSTRVVKHPEIVVRAVEALRLRAEQQPHVDAQKVAKRAQNLADKWNQVAQKSIADNTPRPWSGWDRDAKGLAAEMLHVSPEKLIDDEERKFVAPTSMRDTEPTVHLWLTYKLGRRTE